MKRRPALFLFLAFIVAQLLSCAGSKADAQLRAAECDILFEYQRVENDSISLLAGNTFRLHTGKTRAQEFYPLLVSIRNPENLDISTGSEVLQDAAAVVAFLKKRFQFLSSFGVVIGESVAQDPAFDRAEAIARIREIAQSAQASALWVFEEKNGEIVSSRQD